MENPSQKPLAPQPKNQESNERVKDATVKTLAVLGLIAILSLGSYLVVRYAPKAIHGISTGASSLSSKFAVGSNNLSLVSNKSSIDSGEAFMLTWKNKDTAPGVYSLTYPCTNGVHLEAIRNNTTEVVFCDKTYDFQNPENTLTLAGISTTQAFVDLPITLVYDKADGKSDTSKVTVTIANQVGNVTPVTPTPSPTPSATPVAITPKPTPPPPTPTPTPSPKPTPSPTPTTGTNETHVYNLPTGTNTNVSNPVGFVDLIGRVLATGYIYMPTNVFVASPEIKLSDRGAVKFEIKNSGTKASGAWKFIAVLPTSPSYTFESDTQVSLNPGDRVEFVLAFDGVAPQNVNLITIKIDPQNTVAENNENNNTLTQNISVNLNQ